MTEKVGGVEFDIIVDGSKVTSVVAKSEAELKKLQDAFMKVEGASVKALDAPAKKAPAAAKGLRNVRAAAGQLGFQMQDVAVQLQSGTNAMIVLGQQGSQVASIFGPTGAVVGAVIAVGAALSSVLIPGLMDSGDETEELTSKLKELQKENKLTANQIAFLEQEERKELEAKKERIAEIDKEIKAINEATLSGGNYTPVIAAAANINKDFADALKSTLPSITGQAEELKKLKAERDLLEGKTGGKIVDTESNKEAVKSAQQRVDMLQNALYEEQSQISSHLQIVKAMQDGHYTEMEAKEIERNVNSLARAQQQFDQLKTQLQMEKDAILTSEDLTQQQKQALQSEYGAIEQQALQAKNLSLEKEQMRHESAMSKIAEMEKQSKINALSSTFSNLSTLMNTENEKLFKIGKAAAVAGAIVDGYAAVSKTMASVPYPFNIPLAAAQAIASAAQVKGILSTNMGDKNPGQIFAGGQVATPTTQQQAPQQRNISIAIAGDNFSADGVRELIDRINEASGDGVSINMGS